MKFLIVLCAALACAVAKPQFLAPWALPHAFPYSAASPLAYSASPLGHPIAYSAPLAAPVTYSSYRTYSAAPIAYSAPVAARLAAPIAYSAPVAARVAAPIAYSAPVAARVAAPIAYSAPVAAPVAAPVVAPVVAPVATASKTQYHAQDELGQASYGHSEPSQAHHASQDAFGNKVGSFSYTSPDGRILKTDYVADALGYRVTSNAVPVAHRIAKRDVTLLQTPASTALAYSHHAIAAPVAYSHHAIAAPVAYSHHAVAAPVAYSHHAIAAPVAYSHHAVAAPVAYSHHAVAAPIAYSAAPAVHAVSTGAVLRDAVQTTVVNTPGHAVSYRVD